VSPSSRSSARAQLRPGKAGGRGQPVTLALPEQDPLGGPASEQDQDRAVRELLRDLGSKLRRGSEDGATRAQTGGQRLSTGLPQIDHLTGGGFPAGRLSEIYGPVSSGRTSVALGLLAQATRAGEVAAIVDPARSFDPASAQAVGADLERLLWLHPRSGSQSGRCCQQLLEAGGFALVFWDLGQVSEPALPIASWQKLARAAPASATALLVLTGQRSTGTCADLVLEMQSARPHFSEPPELLEGLEIEAVVVRHRSGPDQRAASVRLDARRGAA
jgi:hypothetical protein